MLAVACAGALLAALGMIRRAPNLTICSAVAQAVATSAVFAAFEHSALEGEDPTSWRVGFGLLLLVDAYAAYWGWRSRRGGATR